ncbi:MAG: D-alanyl-D-alanine carboxypeptidase/D-alanyl-D-alanine-endopeptidase, partial [Deltaproteobacteria bacterium]|nr:D-alanyl-D-alanine carboxypeptidase/D-alanyl-D-alanine-endopeptidase [Deltaproteobacteria bacterium]
KPASVQKILTSIIALKKLGPAYRFATRLFLEGYASGSVKKLYVKGFGDPSFTTESMWVFVRQLRKLGIKKIEHVVFDDTAFVQRPSRTGQRAYESTASALPFNFNSIALEVCPAGSSGAAVVTPDPWDLPIQISGSIRTALRPAKPITVQQRVLQNGSLAFSVAGEIGAGESCRAIYRSVDEPRRYFAASFLGFAKLLGINVPSAPLFGATPASARQVYEYKSKPLALIVQDLNHFSTNFIGEQIVFALGENGGYYDREKGLERMKAALLAMKVPAAHLQIRDGSGLSHDNLLTARALSKFLLSGMADEAIRPDFEASLSVAGRSGTLKKRAFDPPGNVVRAKTGTLNGVNTLSGFLTSSKGRRLAFTILQNGVASREQALALEDQIVESIYRVF